MKTTSTKIRRSFLSAAAILFAAPLAAQAALQVNFPASELDDQGCQLIKAGQTIDAGKVCVELDDLEENLLVTYSTAVEDGWELVEAQLWAGLNPLDMPATRKGAPKIGNFPYNSGNIDGDITGETVYPFTVPLETFGDLQFLCDNPGSVQPAYLAAHSSLQRYDEFDGYQTETGWSLGTRIVEKGTWAMMSVIEFTCPLDAAPLPELVQNVTCSGETAFALGENTFVEDGDDLTVPNTNRWGWQITLENDGIITKEIYAGAGQNDISKGTHIGTLTLVRDKGLLTVTFDMFSEEALWATMSETHLYVGDTEVPVAAPGQYSEYGYLVDSHGGWDTELTTDEYQVEVNATGPVYVVAHAATTVCKVSE